MYGLQRAAFTTLTFGKDLSKLAKDNGYEVKVLPKGVEMTVDVLNIITSLGWRLSASAVTFNVVKASARGVGPCETPPWLIL